MILFYIVYVLHYVIYWPLVLFGSFISVQIAEFNMIYLMPITYILYLFTNKCILAELEDGTMNNNSDLAEEKRKDLLLYNVSFKLNAISALVLGYIISVYSIYIKKNNIQLF
jgi:hypothetical protein